jgi:hypothetical protein
MALDVGQAVSQLLGVLVGGAVTGTIAAFSFRWQRRDALAAEERARRAVLADELRAREVTASELSRDSLVRLRLLGADPDLDRKRELDRRLAKGDDYAEITADLGPPDKEWTRARGDLIVAFETAALDIGDRELRSRLAEASQILVFYYGPEKYEGSSEQRTRYIAVKDALDCLGAFRRGDPLPERSANYRNTYAWVQEYLAEEWS